MSGRLHLLRSESATGDKVRPAYKRGDPWIYYSVFNQLSIAISRKVVRKNVHATIPRSREAIWDMINTLFLAL